MDQSAGRENHRSRGARDRYPDDPITEGCSLNANGKCLKLVDTFRGVYVGSISGGRPDRLLIENSEEERYQPTSFSPDGRNLLVYRTSPEGTQVQRVSLKEEGEIETLEIRESNPTGAFYSPDGRYISYVSDESGRREAYVRPVNTDGSLGPSRMISTAGMNEWAPWKFTEPGQPMVLFFFGSGGKIVEATITGHPAPSVSELREPLDAEALRMQWITYLPDGRAIATQRSEEEDRPREIKVVQGFFEDLKQRVPLN